MTSRRFERRYPFQVIRQLGKGAMGSVLEVRLPGDPRPHAAKILNSQHARSRERFRREGELMSRLRHPGIVSVTSAGVLEDGSPYLIVDLVEGESLLELLTRERVLLEPRALAIAADLADALHHAHQAGIVHRDVKPANVLIDAASGRPRLTDFGIALAADQDRLTKTGAWAGTPLYMAPEQLGGGEISAATDVYALGAVLFQMLSGETPFDEGPGAPLVPQILSKIAPDVRSLRPSCTQAAARIVARCLEKEPSQRYASAEQLALDLRAAGRGESVHTGSTAQLMVRGLRRAFARRLVQRVALAGFVLCAAAGVGWVGLRRQQRAELTDLAAQLDAARVSLRQVDAQVDAAEGLLESSAARLADAPEGVEGAMLRAAWSGLQRAVGQRRALALDDADLDAGEPGGWLVRVESYAAVPAGKVTQLKDRAERRFEAQRGRVLALGGRLEEARRSCLAVLEAASRDSLGRDDPAHVLAWVELLSGQAPAARRRLADAEPELVVELELAEAWRTGEREPLAAALESLPAGQDAESRLLRAWARAVALAQDADAFAVLQLLREVRAISDPPRVGELDPFLQARACLLEGELAWRLGWAESAAHAFAQAQGLLPAQAISPWVGLTVRGPDGQRRRVVLPARLAAGLGEAQARSDGLDAAGALDAARAGRGWAELGGDPGLQVLAELLLAEALSCGLQPEEAGEALARARALGAAPEATATVTAQLARRRGESAPGLPRPSAERLCALGEASAKACYKLQKRLTPEHPLLQRACRGLELALAGEPSVAARAWAALARLHLLSGSSARAREAAARGLSLAPDDWLVVASSALANVEEAAGHAQLQRALDLLRAGEQRELERLIDTQWVLLRAANQLQRVRAIESAASVWTVAAEHARDAHLPVGYQRAVTAAAVLAADRAKDSARKQRLGRMQHEQLQVGARHGALWSKVREQWERPDMEITNELAALDQLLRESPAYGPALTHRWSMFRRVNPEGYHSLALAYELSPGMASDHMDDFRAGFAHRSIVGVVPECAAAEPVADPELSLAADPDLQVAVTILMGKTARVDLLPEHWWRGYQAAERFFLRRPRSAGAQVAFACYQLELGDPAGSLHLLEVARATPPPFDAGSPHLGQVIGFYQAQAHGALRQWGPMAQALEAIYDARFGALELTRDPRLWLDRELAASLHPAVQAKLDAWQAASPR